MRETRSTCPYCGVGCGVIIQSEGAQITGVRGDPDHPANFGRLCTKGSTLHLTAAAPINLHARLLHPLRRESRGEAPVRIGWEQALDEAAERFAGVIERHGPDAVGFYVSGQLLTEDYYVFNKLAKGLVGTNNIDTNSRLCMSSAVAGYKLTLGADAPPCSYEDIELADTVFIVGSNMAFAHPVLFRRLEAAKQARPGMKIIVADPRRTETAEMADLYLPLLPGSDVALFNGMLHAMLWEGLVDNAFIEQHTTGFDALRDSVRDYAPKDAARLCGIDESALLEAARDFGRRGGATLSLYCQGLNQSTSGTAKNVALLNLHLAAGQIGKPGAGPFSLTGQPNAMGGREVGGLANLLSAHRDLADPVHRAEVARLWGIDDVPSKPGRTAVEMFQAAADGEIRALWIACTNPAQSMPDQTTVRRALERAEYVVVQEAFATTATCRYADLLLPATTWGEKNGTVTNSERRISRVRRAVDAPGDARPDWQIAARFAERLQERLAASPPGISFAYADAESVWNEHRESTRGRDLDITGLSYQRLDERPEQWPFPASATTGRTRLYADAVFATPDGKARFVPAAFQPTAEQRDARHPFSLTTGRLRDQWHGMSRTGTLGVLFGHVAEPAVEMNPQDMARLRIAEGDLVQVASRRGGIVLPTRASAQLAPTQAFIAMHWGDEFLGGHTPLGMPATGVNALTSPQFCPTSKQPELKHCAVKVSKVALPWRLLGLAWLEAPDALMARQALTELMPRFAFATCVPFGRERHGVLFRAADVQAASDALIEEIERLLGLDGRQVLHYSDSRRGQRRSVKMSGEGSEARVEAFLLGGDTSAESWIRDLLERQLPAQGCSRALLQPGLQAPPDTRAPSRQVCTCFGIAQPEIEELLSQCSGTAEQRLTMLQSRLACGTNCGSCLPELKRLARLHAAPV
jgi:assimilatory nitrate reductase catalytic subunit